MLAAFYCCGTLDLFVMSLEYNGIDAQLIYYVEHEIIPRYADFDKAHREDHVRSVIDRSMNLLERMPDLDREMVYVVAAFHDLGLCRGREYHHVVSGEILENDQYITRRFSAEQIKTMKEAVEDHRASNGSRPRNDYGLVVAEADRLIDAETIVRRTVQYGLSHYPELDREGHFRRTVEHLNEKYGPDGYLKIWLPWSDNVARLRELHHLIADHTRLRLLFDRLYDSES